MFRKNLSSISKRSVIVLAALIICAVHAASWFRQETGDVTGTSSIVKQQDSKRRQSLDPLQAYEGTTAVHVYSQHGRLDLRTKLEEHEEAESRKALEEPHHFESDAQEVTAPETETLVLGEPSERRPVPDSYSGLFDGIRSQISARSLRVKKDYSSLIPSYDIPNIENTKLVNCRALLEGVEAELLKAEKAQKNVAKVPIYEETYDEWFHDCDKFRRDRGYVEVPTSQEEADYPLAFSIAMFKDFEQTERLLRAIYQPQNFYCIHVDTKTPLLIHRTVHSLAQCFDNVFVATRLDKIKWGDISVILPDINCMTDFVKYYRGKWKYYINLTGQEFPLRTNWEIVQIAKIFNGSNDLGGSKARMEKDRVDYKWSHRWSKTYSQTVFFNTYEPKESNQWNLTFFKGELHGLFSRKMVEYMIESDVGKGYLEWCWNTGHPSEHYYNALNYNVHLKVPGGYEGPLDIADQYSLDSAIRAKHWVKMNYGDRKCHGTITRGICVYGVRDLPWLHTRDQVVANKFYLLDQYLTLDCLEERHRNRTLMRDRVSFSADYYRNLPTVLYSRKDGV